MIRVATEADIPELVRLCHLFWAETAYKAVPYCAESMAQTLQGMIDNSLLFVADHGGIAGLVGAAMAPAYFNYQYLIVSELLWWIAPEHRGNGTGTQLMQALESAAREGGATVLGMMCLDAIDPEKVSKMYAKAGFAPAERTFVKFL